MVKANEGKRTTKFLSSNIRKHSWNNKRVRFYWCACFCLALVDVIIELCTAVHAWINIRMKGGKNNNSANSIPSILMGYEPKMKMKMWFLLRQWMRRDARTIFDWISSIPVYNIRCAWSTSNLTRFTREDILVIFHHFKRFHSSFHGYCFAHSCNSAAIPMTDAIACIIVFIHSSDVIWIK